MKKDEEENFKDKFDLLNDVVEQRHVLRTGINAAKQQNVKRFKTDSPDFGSKSMKRVTSQAAISHSQSIAAPLGKRSKEDIDANATIKGHRTVSNLIELKRRNFET